MFPRLWERAVAFFQRMLLAAFEEAERKADAMIAQRFETQGQAAVPAAPSLPPPAQPNLALPQQPATVPVLLPPQPPMPAATDAGAGKSRSPAAAAPRSAPEGAAAVLTTGHERLLRHLCRDLRILTDEQAGIIIGHGADGPGDLLRELGGLVTRDLLRRERVIARVLPRLDAPLAVWQPGQDRPEMAAVAWQAQKRWDVSPRVVTAFRAGPRARRLFGHTTAGGPGNLSALSHDLACGELLLAFSRLAPQRLRDWGGEGLRKPEQGYGEKLPDVILYAADHSPYLVCEVTGVYPKARLDAFHDYVADVLGLPYELW